jgi:hypothetical protein
MLYFIFRLSYPVESFELFACKDFTLFGFPIFNYGGTFWWLFQKSIDHTSLNTYLYCCYCQESSLSTQSKHEHILCFLTEDTTDNPIIIRPQIMFTDGRRPTVITIRGRIMISLSLYSGSKHNIWSYYDWVFCCCRPSVNTICGRIMIGLSLLLSVSKHNMWSYYDWVVVVVDDNNDNPIIIRPHIVFTDGQQQ